MVNRVASDHQATRAQEVACYLEMEIIAMPRRFAEFDTAAALLLFLMCATPAYAAGTSLAQARRPAVPKYRSTPCSSTRRRLVGERSRSTAASSRTSSYSVRTNPFRQIPTCAAVASSRLAEARRPICCRSSRLRHLTLSETTLKDGYGTYGAIENLGRLTIRNSTLTDSIAIVTATGRSAGLAPFQDPVDERSERP